MHAVVRLPHTSMHTGSAAPVAPHVFCKRLLDNLDKMHACHVLQGLAPLSLGRSRMAAAALGALWGFGHSTGQFILGLIFALLKVNWTAAVEEIN
eukprot:366130-Chlamydomonas_euryale.AAC.17